MKAIHMHNKSGCFDLRFEPALDIDHSMLSENARALYRLQASQKWADYEALVTKIDRGDATGSEQEQELVYDGFCELFNQLHDVTQMLYRRDAMLEKLAVLAHAIND